MRTIEFTKSDGEVYTVEGIPDEAKITFAGVRPDAGPGYNGAAALRIYKGARADNGSQLAVFQNVVEFRDLSITVTKVTNQGKQTWIGSVA